VHKGDKLGGKFGGLKIMKSKKVKKYTKKDIKVFKELLLKLKARLSEQILSVEKEAMDK